MVRGDKGSNTTRVSIRLRDEVVEYLREYAYNRGDTIGSLLRRWIEDNIDKRIKK